MENNDNSTPSRQYLRRMLGIHEQRLNMQARSIERLADVLKESLERIEGRLRDIESRQREIQRKGK